jgi:hypothetical protein
MITGTDAYGSWLDTGCNTQPTQRANVELEVHNANEIDTGSKLTIAQVEASHVPHRAANSPR